MLRRFLSSLLLLAPAAALGAQAPQSVRPDSTEGPRSGGAAVAFASAVRAPSAPELDGREDDDVWRLAPALDGFRQFAPVEDGDTDFRTVAKVAYDDENLYVLVRAYDAHPDSIVSLLSRRDVRTASEWIKVVVDGYHDRRTGFQFMVNPAGVKRDASIFDDINEDVSWDGIWDARTSIDSLGWVAEFRIPLSQVRFRPGASQTFGFGIWRDIARRNQRDSWPVYRPSQRTFSSQLGELRGLEGLRRTGRLELLPYAVAKSEPALDADARGQHEAIAGGLDLKYGVTQSLTLDATVNPDFGQVEADPSVLNLSAFEIRFEERRPFFQEGVNLFRCGGPCEGIFYTRRIGRAPQLGFLAGAQNAGRVPHQSTILGAAKLTGRVTDNISVGFVEAVTQREEVAGITVEPQTNYAVGRAVAQFRQGRSSVGTMVTAVNRALDERTERYLRREAQTVLLQGFHRFGPGSSYEVMSYAGVSRVAGTAEAIASTQLSSVHFHQRPDHEEEFDPTRTSMVGSVQAVQLQKLAGVFRFSSNVRNAGTNVEMNDFGLVTLINDRSLTNAFDLATRRPGSFYRRLSLSFDTEHHWTSGGLPAGNRFELESFIELPSSWNAEMELAVRNATAAHCVSCARGGPAVRQDRAFEAEFFVGGDPRPAFVPYFGGGFTRGDGGRSSSAFGDLSADLRVASRFSASLGLGFSRNLDAKQWVANLGSTLTDTAHFTFARLEQSTLDMTARANFTATPTLSLQLYAQPFVSTGRFTDWRELADARAEDFDARYVPFGGGARPDGFNVKEFNSNAVLRWEYRPGSTLFLVWQQGREEGAEGPDVGEFRFSRDYRDLFRSRPRNVVLVKWSYWFSL